MDSLTKIINKIEQDNSVACQGILDEANQMAESILANAKDRAELSAKKILAEGEKQAEDLILKAKSSAELNYKRKLLAAKVKVMESTLEAALKELSALPDKDYFEIILSLSAKASEGGDAVLLLNDRDMGRLPESFSKELEKALAQKGKVIIRGGADLPFGGFILQYAETSVNCGFDALLDDVKDEAKDALSNILFK